MKRYLRLEIRIQALKHAMDLFKMKAIDADHILKKADEFERWLNAD